MAKSNKYTERIKKEGLNLVLLKNNKTLFKSNKDGMKPLLQAINTLGLTNLEDTVVVDRIVGKAVALIAIYIKAKEIHCIVLSMNAKKLLKKHRKKYYFERLTPKIMNKKRTAICPYEKTVINIEEPETAYKQLLEIFYIFKKKGKRSDEIKLQTS